MSPAVLAERELLKQEAKDAKAQEAIVSTSTPSWTDFDVFGESLEEKVEIDVAEEKGCDHDVGVHAAAEPLSGGKVSPEAMVPSLKVLQRGAMSLLRFLLIVSMRQASLPLATRDSSGGASNRVKGIREDREQDGSEERRAEGGAKSTRSEMMLIPPTRDRSMYGTPVEQMRTHMENLHQVRLVHVTTLLRYDAMCHSANQRSACSMLLLLLLS